MNKSSNAISYEIILGRKLKYCRKSIRFTQIEFGNYFYIDRGSISNYELGKNAPSIQYLLKISRWFDLVLEDLVDNEFSVDDFKAKYPPPYLSQKANSLLVQ